ncbi:hypothetical protein [Desulfosporosinus metallidurans]|uniref:hypothetical protein n=1 Tax=Desulfosporosinus metallidurans TaxID=1888891 RepID=UPI00094CC043|nr:hypothetical protein [Desulfosporosinus metallidurans]
MQTKLYDTQYTHRSVLDVSVNFIRLSNLREPDGAAEGNFISSYFVSHNALHYYKFVGVGLLCMCLIYVAKRNQSSVIRVLWASNFVFGLIVVSNIVVYFIQTHHM